MTDEEIYLFCDSNKEDIRCKCLNPDASIIKIGEAIRLPYYCWYEPCKRNDAFLVHYLKQNISRCNVSDCTVSLGNVVVKDGYLDVKNVCGSKLQLKSEINKIKYLNQEIKYPVFHPKWIPIFLIAVSTIILLNNTNY
ncbi:70L protein [Yaba-like disease virus]|uniref:70L protein n=1 Tax=Yaba-like disease virus TaxID=132475 RepID=Q9DHP3_YLDV|nr:70L protein [Yaba-like disease virus]CAC21308.1 70L protein [Yaba-like disease virus]